MIKIRKVNNVGYSKLNDCVVITYEDDGKDKFAACRENLVVECGNTVEIYRDDCVNYKGLSAMELKVV
ncbi:MAG: hypothetical protein K2O32_01445 [Acetatifactor sp.]|nr:hypothetical protein [Acetatifactor sp.]